MSFSSLYAGMFTGFILYRPCADHEFMSTVVLLWPEYCVVFLSSLILKIFWYFHFVLHDCPWILGGRWSRYLVCDRACLWNVFPTFWAVARFCINHCPPHNETFLMRSESSIVYTVMQFGGKFDTMSILQSSHSRFTSRACEVPYCLFFARFIVPGVCFLLQSRP